MVGRDIVADIAATARVCKEEVGQGRRRTEGGGGRVGIEFIWIRGDILIML